MCYRTDSCIPYLIMVFQNLFLSYGSYNCAKVPVGTISWNKSDLYRYIYLLYRYESTLRYYWTYTYFTDTGVPGGTTGLIFILPLREYS